MIINIREDCLQILEPQTNKITSSKSENKPKESEVWLRTLEKMGPPQANWISVTDCANDTFDFLDNSTKLGWKYVVRARHNHQVKINGKQTRFFSWIQQSSAKCTSKKMYLRARSEGVSGEVSLEVIWIKAKLFPPGNRASVADEEVTYIRVWSPGKPKLEKVLIANLPVNNEEDVLKVINIYRRHRLIEDYHKVVKTGFRIEDNQLKQASRILELLLSAVCICLKFKISRLGRGSAKSRNAIIAIIK